MPLSARRRRMTICAAVAIVIALATLGICISPWILDWRKSKDNAIEWWLTGWRAPAKLIVAQRRLSPGQSGDHTVWRIETPTNWMRINAVRGVTIGQRDATVFTGYRTSRGGQTRLVTVIREVGDDNGEQQFTTWSMVPYRGRDVSKSIGNSVGDRSTPARWFAGQADPSDASHLTIEYGDAAADSIGILDGWLHDDGTVKLKYRDSDAIYSMVEYYDAGHEDRSPQAPTTVHTRPR